MAKMREKTEKAFEWAKGWSGLDGYLKLNALVNKDGQASFNAVYNEVAIERYLDGTAKRQYTFQVRFVTRWSDGYDRVNLEAEKMVTEWLDWIDEQYELGNVPDWGVDILDIEASQNIPALNAVYEDESLAEYVIQAVITYIE